MELDEQYYREIFSRVVIGCKFREKMPTGLVQGGCLWGEWFSMQGRGRVGHLSDSFSVDMLKATSLGSLPEALERPGLDLLIQRSMAQRGELNGTVF